MAIGRACGCHQMQKRSFLYKGRQFPLCARCTGLAIGEFVLAPILWIFGFDHVLISSFFILPLAIDGTLQYFRLIESNNIRRLITGLLAGIGLATLVLIAFMRLFSFR
ncbi:MAG: DUF2085 domain-containing protein [Acholeplasmataceae bacterium]